MVGRVALTHERRPHRGGCGLRGAVGPRGASCIGHCSGARSRARPFKCLGGDDRSGDSPPSISAARADRARRNSSQVDRDSHLGGAPQKKAARRATASWRGCGPPDQLERGAAVTLRLERDGEAGRIEADLEKKSRIDRIRARGERERASAKRVFQGKYEGKAVPKTSEPGGAKRGNGRKRRFWRSLHGERG